MNTKILSLVPALLILGSLSACGGSPAAPAPVDAGPTVDPNLVFTSGAQTVVAQITLDAASRPVPTVALPPTQTMDVALPTLEPLGTPANGLQPAAGITPGALAPAAGITPGAVITLPASVPTLGSVNTLAAASTPAGTAAPIVKAIPDKLQWVSNTPPDKSTVAAGKKFKITWRLSNVGTTIWDSTYAFKFYAGTQMATSASYQVSKDVAPNKSYDFTVDAVAPTTPGDYYSLWVLQRQDGINVGKFDITLTVK
jgi:hypothetical protein